MLRGLQVQLPAAASAVPLGEENLSGQADVRGDLGALDSELQSFFVGGPEGSAKRRRTGLVPEPVVWDG